jgi:hypothetical protein
VVKKIFTQKSPLSTISNMNPTPSTVLPSLLSTFKRLTYDFPESKWAACARAQLSQESLLNLETKLELERLEGEQ